MGGSRQGETSFTDERVNTNSIFVSGSCIAGGAQPQVLYSGTDTSSVSAPGGIAVDNFHAFWTNKAVGTEAGSVVRGYEALPAAGSSSSSPTPVQHSLPQLLNPPSHRTPCHSMR